MVTVRFAAASIIFPGSSVIRTSALTKSAARPDCCRRSEGPNSVILAVSAHVGLDHVSPAEILRNEHLPVSQDIRPLLDEWSFDPDQINVRTIVGHDGRTRIQLRLDLGILQMEVDDRPDGLRVEGCKSWLDYHVARQAEHDAAHPDGIPYLLENADCNRLLREGVQYYHRYLCFWQLKWYELCARDTARNLRLFDFVRAHAREEQDRLQFDQWRPYVTMMHARAVATPLIETRQWDASIAAIDAGIRNIEQFLRNYGQESKAEHCGELTFLKKWRLEVARHLESGSENGNSTADSPIDPVTALHEQLATAIAEESYEEAARIRDQIRQMDDPPPPSAEQRM